MGHNVSRDSRKIVQGVDAANDRPLPSNSTTLKEIADITGVHISTVSRVLRQTEPATGWTDAALRVRDAAEKLGYRPNFLAASLRTRKTQTIGVVMPRLTDGVIATTCQSIEESARLAGYQVLLATPPDEMGAQLASIEMLISRQVDGLILSSLHQGDEASIRRIEKVKIPLIATNRHVGVGIPSVTSADRHGGFLATEHLIGLGHRRIGIIAGPKHASTAWDRATGYFDALEKYGIALDESLVAHTEFEVSGGVDGAHRLLNLEDPPTAIFAINDTAAIGAMGAARDRGLRIPFDLSLVGYNDIPIVSQLPTPLTTVSASAGAMGAVALQQLLRGIAGHEMASMVLPVSLVVRSSTSVPRG